MPGLRFAIPTGGSEIHHRVTEGTEVWNGESLFVYCPPNGRRDVNHPYLLVLVCLTGLVSAEKDHFV